MSEQSGKYVSSVSEVIIDQTTIAPTALDEETMFKPKLVARDCVTPLSDIKKTAPEQFVKVKAKVHRLGSVSLITTKRNRQTLRKQEGILVDTSDQIKIVLWKDQVNTINPIRPEVLLGVWAGGGRGKYPRP